MKAEDFTDVFEAYPETDEIFVVDGMPFTNKEHALGHERGTKKPLVTIKRSGATVKAAAEQPTKPKTKKELAAELEALAAAEKAAAAAEPEA